MADRRGGSGGDRAGTAGSPAFEERYARLLASVAAVRAIEADNQGDIRVPPSVARGAAALAATGLVIAGTVGARAPLRAAAESGADQAMFAAVNQDRSSNGVGPLGYNGTLQTVAEAWPYPCNGITVRGRAYDMLQRGYFAHLIPGCGRYVFSMMSAAGVPYTSAGENIGWSSGFGSVAASVGYLNTALMNSLEHRANILDPNYTAMGVGSDWTAGPWSGGGGPFTNVAMMVELFVQQGSPPPPPRQPPPPPPPRPAPVPATPPPLTVHTTPVPVPPLAAVPAPTPAPALDKAPPAVPPGSPVPGVPPPLEVQPNGLLGGSVEAVLEGFLLD